MARAGLLVSGGVLAAVGLFLLTLMDEAQWFPFILLAIGSASLVGGAIPSSEPGRQSPPARQANPPADLRALLAEVDTLRQEGVLSAEEHRGKRRDLLDAWGRP